MRVSGSSALPRIDRWPRARGPTSARPLGLVPSTRHAKVIEASVSWNYTTYLNIAFLILAAVLVYRFVRTGGMPMLKMMGGRPDDMTQERGESESHHGSTISS